MALEKADSKLVQVSVMGKKTQKFNELIPQIAMFKGSRYLFQGPSFWETSSR